MFRKDSETREKKEEETNKQKTEQFPKANRRIKRGEGKEGNGRKKGRGEIGKKGKWG